MPGTKQQQFLFMRETQIDILKLSVGEPRLTTLELCSALACKQNKNVGYFDPSQVEACREHIRKFAQEAARLNQKRLEWGPLPGGDERKLILHNFEERYKLERWTDEEKEEILRWGQRILSVEGDGGEKQRPAEADAA